MALTKEEYFKKVAELNPHIKIMSEFKGVKNSIQYICPHCHELNEIKSAGNLYRKEFYGCRDCFLKKMNSERTEKSKNNIINKIKNFRTIKINNINKSDKGGKDNKLIFNLHCDVCGHDWSVLGSNIRNKWRGCPECYKQSEEFKENALKGAIFNAEKGKENTKKRFETFLNKNKYKLINQINEHTTKTSISLKCEICGEEWSTQIAHCLKGNGDCKACNGYKVNEYYLKKYINENRKDIKLVKFKHKGKSIFKCLECGKTFKQYHNQVMKGGKCIHCNITKGEIAVKSILEDLNKKFKMQHSFKESEQVKRLRFDFYLPNESVCIEYQGEQHYRPIDYFGGEEKFKAQVKKDNLKRQFCKANNIKLIEIPYYEKDIKEFLMNELNKENLKIVA